MKAYQRGLVKESLSPYIEIQQALRAHPDTDRGPDLLAYASVARVNPYQSLLYREFPAHGFAPAPFHAPFQVKDLDLWKRQTSSRSLHLHWTGYVTANASDESTASSRVKGYLSRLERFSETGGKLIWTTHNVYPHDARFVEAELALQQGLADLSDAIHVMAESTLEVISPYTKIDKSKIVVSPHPSYIDSYENHVTRHDARSRLGISHDERVILLFGALKSYKGISRLYSAFKLAKSISEFPIKLLVAGAPDSSPDVKHFVDDCLKDPDVIIDPARISGNQAQVFLNAADLGIATYDRILNSGAALLYLSFGLPVVATDTLVMREALPKDFASFLSTSASVDEFAKVLLESVSERPDRNLVRQSIADLHPSVVSSRFAKGLRAKLRL